MGYFKWPFVFCLVYGLHWVRAKLWENGNSSPAQESASLPTLQSEDPSSEASLSYAFQKVHNSTREPAAQAPVTAPELSDFEKAFASLQTLRRDPEKLQAAVQKELSLLGPDRVIERSVLLREAYSSFDHDLSPHMTELLQEEREWLARNSTEIPDPVVLDGYVQEITKFTIQNSASSQEKIETLKMMTLQLSNNPLALKAFRRGILGHAEWDLPEILDSAPLEVQFILQHGM